MLHKRQSFKGGYKFRKLTGIPKTYLRDIGIPKEVIILMQQGFGEEVPLIVKLGDIVKAGQIVGINDNSCSSPIHATVNGTVKDIISINRWERDISALVIESDGIF